MLGPPLASPGKRLRELIEKDVVVLPGVWGAISAKAAAAAGAEALYLSGAGVTNSLLAAPDIALLSLEEMARQARYVTQAVSLPVLADADTGYGDVHNVSRAVIELEQAGLAGIHIEDQESPKRCGHLDGKAVIPARDMAAKLAAAAESKRDASFLIVARTDARAVEGMEAAIERAKRYEGAGADAIFPEGLESEEEFAAFRSAVRAPLLANMTEFGKTPLIPVSRFRELGYNMVIFPMTAFRVMLKAAGEAYETLLREGSQTNLLPKMRTRAELYALLDYAAYEARDRTWAERAAGKDA